MQPPHWDISERTQSIEPLGSMNSSHEFQASKKTKAWNIQILIQDDNLECSAQIF